MASKVAEAVKVVVRCRPFSKNEVAANHKRAVEMDTTMGVIKVNNPAAPKDEPKSFTFDTVFDWNSTQVNVYQATAYPIVESVLGGYNGTVFAYGQTGTGKTFTMEGIRSDKDLRGIIPNSFQHIFDKINLSNDVQYLVRVSYLEIYNEVIRDLLSNDPKAKLDLKEHPEKGVYVKDLSQVVVGSVEAMDEIMNMGNSNRTVGFTNMNATSSRSHSIFSITLESSSPGPDGKPIIRAGKLHLVDLAGSERQEKTGATGIRLKEATKINLSLSALGNVISALVDGKAQHIPYRDSKLTRLLQDSLGGNSRTVMVANLGPAEYNFDETMSTLRYANRAKNIKNKPKINEDPKDALLREYQEEIERLKVQLLQRSSKGGSGGGTSATTGGTTTTREGKVIKVNDTEAVEKMRKAKEAEMRAFLEKKDIATSERKKIEAELRAHEQRTRMEEMEQKELEERLKEMQDKVMGGNEHIIDETKKQEAILRQTATDLEKKAYEEKMLKRQLAEAQENQALKEEKYSSLQQEVDVKSKKLKKLVLKLTEAKAEVRDVQSEWQREKEDMLDSVRDLTNQLKLKMAIIDNFIPRAEAARLEQRAIWDEDVHIWRTKPITHSDPHLKSQRPGSAMANGKRPVSEYARLAKTASSDNPRFKTDNIISLSLDMPERTTQDYTVPAVAPRVQAALSAALAEEDEVTMGDWAEKKTSRSSSGDVGGNAENFPKARGIISRAGRR